METILVFAPAIGAAICGTLWRWIGEPAALWIAILSSTLAALLAGQIALTTDGAYSVELGRGIVSGTLDASWHLSVDRFAAGLAFFALVLTALAQVFTVGFGAVSRQFKPEESYRPKIAAGLGVLGFGALLLIFAGNMLQLIAGWEVMLAAVYLLTGVFFRKTVAIEGAVAVLVVGRLASLALILTAALGYLATGSLAISTIAEADITGLSWLTVIAVAVILGQLPAQFGLLAAGEAPMPAAFAGLILGFGLAAVVIAERFQLQISGAPAGSALVVLGLATALYASSVALMQTDIRRLLAGLIGAKFSFLAVWIGLGMSFVAMLQMLGQAAAFACLYFGVGALIQAKQCAPDLRQLGGLRGLHPWTFLSMGIGALGVSFGVASFALSESLHATSGAGTLLSVLWTDLHPAAAVLAGLCWFATALATWRLVFSLFFGKSRATEAEQAQTAWTLRIPQAVATAIVVGLGLYAGVALLRFGAVSAFDGAAIAVALLGLGVAYIYYVAKPGLSRDLRDRRSGLHDFLLNGWHLDRLLQTLLVAPITLLSKLLWRGGDDRVLGGGTHVLASGLAPRLGKSLVRSQASPYYNYAFAVILGLVLVIALISFRALN